MRNILIYGLVFACFFLTINCSQEIEDTNRFEGKPYHKFTAEDKIEILNPLVINQSFTFRNQNNDEIIFKVIRTNDKISAWISVMGFAGFGTSTAAFYYDEKEVLLSYLDDFYVWSTIEVNIRKHPIDLSQQLQSNSVLPSKLKGYFKFPLWNGYRGIETYNNEIIIDFSLPTIAMILNGKTYTKVQIYESNKTAVLNPNNQLPALPRTVHRIYYDQNFGVIGFDELNGKMWRIQ